jgi:hypothetical protein
VLAADALKPPRAKAACGLVFLDPPYGKELVPRSLAALAAAGWIAPDALVCAETGREEALEVPGFEVLAEREHGAARVTVRRFGCGVGQGRCPWTPPGWLSHRTPAKESSPGLPLRAQAGGGEASDFYMKAALCCVLSCQGSTIFGARAAKQMWGSGGGAPWPTPQCRS